MIYGIWECVSTECINKKTVGHCLCTKCGAHRDIRLDVLKSSPPMCDCLHDHDYYSGKMGNGFVVLSKNDDGTYTCKCDCGNVFTATSNQLRNGDIRSCGCAKLHRKDSNVKERECRSCGKKFPGGPRAWYCPECRAIRRKESVRKTAENRRKGILKSPGKEMQCEMCGKTAIRKNPNQRFCEECGKINTQEVDRRQSLEYYQKNKDRINIIRRGEKSIYDPVSVDNPLDFDIYTAFKAKFPENIEWLINNKGAAEIAENVGVSLKTVYSWKNNNWVPSLTTLIKLYNLYGNIVLPYITNKGVIERKSPIKSRAKKNKWIADIVSNAGYTISDAARAMGIPVPLFFSRYNDTIPRAISAIELLYVFGIDDILKYYPTPK